MMKDKKFDLLIGLLLILFYACASKESAVPGVEANPIPQVVAPALQKPAWEAEWQSAIEKAKKEGMVVVTSGMGPHVRKPLGEAFEKKFGIKVEWIAARGSETAERVLRERRAGIYSYDLYTSGMNTALKRLKPAGAILPIEPLLILPEVKDPKNWFQNRLPWGDQDKTILTFWLEAGPNITINTNMVKKEEISSYYNLLEPKWKGKIVMDDPTVTGSAYNWAVTVGELMPSLGWDFQRGLARQEPLLMRDRRLMAEWVARGKYPVTLPNSSQTQEMKRQGAPLDFIITKEGVYGSSGNGHLVYYNNAPHPYAALVFTNWLLTREAQEIAAVAEGTESSRLDATTSHLPQGWTREEVLKAAGSLVRQDSEAFIDMAEESRDMILKIWGHLVGR